MTLHSEPSKHWNFGEKPVKISDEIRRGMTLMCPACEENGAAGRPSRPQSNAGLARPRWRWPGIRWPGEV